MSARDRFEQLMRRILPRGSLGHRIARKTARILESERQVLAVERQVLEVLPRIEDIEEQIADVGRRVRSFEQHLPAFLNAVSSVGAFGFELQRARESVESQGSDIRHLEERLALISCETPHNSSPTRSSFGSANSGPQHRILNPQKIVDASRTGLRLNLGCGETLRDGYVNVDHRELSSIDIVADVGAMALPEGSVIEIFSSHLLEHLPQDLLHRRLLPYWLKLLAKNGLFRAVVLDGEAMLTELSAARYSFEDFRDILFGGKGYNQDAVSNLLTPQTLATLLKDVGYVDIEVLIRGRKNGQRFEFEISARRP